MQAGFFGEVPSSEFITGIALCQKIGLTAGTNQNSTTPWLKFAYMGGIVFIPKKPIRYNLSWSNINAKGAVFGQKIVEVQDQQFQCTLIKGKTEGRQNYGDTFSSNIVQGSMWNLLLGQVHEKAPNSWNYPDNMENTLVNWGINYTDSDLGFNVYSSATLCMEDVEVNGDPNFRITRGAKGVSHAGYATYSLVQSNYYYRPALILIE